MPPPKEIMRPKDLFLFLIGNREAILRIAATPHAWVVGAILVVSAGLARNYDHLDLLREQQWVLGPFVASIFSTFFIFIWVKVGLELPEPKGERRNLPTFLNFVWLTAPCAWIYGIPVELFTDVITATKWNIAFLAIVSLWRVALMTRAVTILTEAPWPRVGLIILFPASMEMMIGSYFKGFSLVGIMGGVRISPEDKILIQATEFTTLVSFWLVIASLVGLAFVKGKAKSPLHRPGYSFPVASILPGCVAVLIWGCFAIPFQNNIQNRYQLKQLFHEKRYEEAILFASSKQRKDFPSLHYLAPEPSYQAIDYPLEHLKLLSPETPAWLREEWIQNAIIAHKYPTLIVEHFRLVELRDNHPEIYDALIDHWTTLKSKSDRTLDEEQWFSRFDIFISLSQ